MMLGGPVNPALMLLALCAAESAAQAEADESARLGEPPPQPPEPDLEIPPERPSRRIVGLTERLPEDRVAHYAYGPPPPPPMTETRVSAPWTPEQKAKLARRADRWARAQAGKR